MARIDKENYYLDIAETVLKRAACAGAMAPCRQERQDHLHRLAWRAQNAELHRPGLLPGTPSRCPRGAVHCATASMPKPTVLSPPPAAPFLWWRYLAGRDSKTEGCCPTPHPAPCAAEAHHQRALIGW